MTERSFSNPEPASHASPPSPSPLLSSAAGSTIVFGSDQTGTNPRFVEFARDADLLVLHMSIAAGTASPLHAAPDARVARDAAARHLILSHIAQFDVAAALADVEKSFDGRVTMGATCSARRPGNLWLRRGSG